VPQLQDTITTVRVCEDWFRCVMCNRYWRDGWTCLRTWRMKHEDCWRRWVYFWSWNWLRRLL